NGDHLDLPVAQSPLVTLGSFRSASALVPHCGSGRDLLRGHGGAPFAPYRSGCSGSGSDPPGWSPASADGRSASAPAATWVASRRQVGKMYHDVTRRSAGRVWRTP